MPQSSTISAEEAAPSFTQGGKDEAGYRQDYDAGYEAGFEAGFDFALNAQAQHGVFSKLRDKRFVSIAATILVEVLIILLLVTLGWNLAQDEPEKQTIVTLEARDFSEAPEEEPPAQAEQPPSDAPTQPQVTPPEPADQPPVLEPLPIEPPPVVLPPPETRPSPAQRPPPPAQRPPARTYGPPNTGRSGGGSDSQRVGTAPNGQPMYAARWYREPTRQELAGYLSTASGPGTALIVCKTVPDFYVEDCQLLGESPQGSQIGRAVMAAAWQFRVRPAVVNGRSQVGSWVRIRIDYTQGPRRRRRR